MAARATGTKSKNTPAASVAQRGMKGLGLGNTSRRRKIVLGLTLLATVAIGYMIASSHAATAAPDPKWLTCQGYPEPRTFVQAQSWWIPDNGSQPGTGVSQVGKGGFDHGHALVGACIPKRDLVITKPFDLDVKVELHMNPATLNRLLVFYKTGGTKSPTQAIVPPGGSMKPSTPLTCPHDAEMPKCERWFHMTVDPATFPFSGLQEVRVRAFNNTPAAQPTVNDDSATFNFQINVKNGKALNEVTRDPFLRGKGVYSEGKLPDFPNYNKPYCEAAYDDRDTPLPTAPLTGMWTPKIMMEDFPSGNVNMPPTYHRAILDPDFHTMPVIPGTHILDGAGSFTGRLAIDTTKLAPGVTHKLFLMTECRDDRTKDIHGRPLVRKSTASGVLVINFTVANQGQGGSLAAPTALSATPASAYRVNLSWHASAGATAYNVYRGVDKVGTTAGTSFQDRDLQPATNYRYTVAATKGAQSTLSTAVNAMTLSGAAPTMTPVPVPTTPPTITPLDLTFAQPASGAVVSGNVLVNANLTGSYADNIDSVVFTIDGNVLGTRYDPDQDYTYLLQFDSTQYSNGPHVLQVRGYNGTGSRVNNTLPINIRNLIR